MKKRLFGFTLIELIIVISITILFAGAGLAQYNTRTQQLKLKNEARKFADVLELAKKKAFSSDLFVQSCNSFNGYRVDLNPGNYLLKFGCDGAFTTLVQRYNFPFNITAVVGTDNYDFKPLNLGTNITSGTITIKNSSLSLPNQCQDISITPIGLISVNETLKSCPP